MIQAYPTAPRRHRHRMSCRTSRSLYVWLSALCGRRYGVQSRVHDGYPPRLRVVSVRRNVSSVREIEGHVTATYGIIPKIFFNHMLFVICADHEVRYSLWSMHLHDVPEDRLLANLHHGFWPEAAFLWNPGSEASGKYYSFHDKTNDNGCVLLYGFFLNRIKIWDTFSYLENNVLIVSTFIRGASCFEDRESCYSWSNKIRD